MNFTSLIAYQDGLVAKGLPGMDIAIHYKGQEVFRYQAGLADLRRGVPITGNTIYGMYSMTKIVTCTAMMQLYEKNLWQLDDPVSHFLPEWAHMHVRDRDAETPVTLKHLFTMTAGLNYDHGTPQMKQMERENPNYSTRDFAATLGSQPLDFEPGTHWQYSMCHEVLAAIIEVLSGERVGDHMRHHIFEPLGMTDSSFTVPEEKLPRVALYYKTNKETGVLEEQRAVPVYSPFFQRGGGGLYSTVNDYAIFAQALCHGGMGPNGHRILKPETVALISSNFLTPEQLTDFQKPGREGYGYGLGVRVLMDDSQGGVKGEFGWSGAAGTHVIIDPATDLTVTLGTQCPDWCAGGSPKTALRDLIYECMKR